MGNFKWNPNAKKQSKKAQLATRRNMNKARLMGFTLDKSGLTDTEILRIKEIRHTVNLLLRDWDENSKKLGMKVERYVLRIRDSKEKPFTIWNTNITKEDIHLLTSHYTKEERKELIKITKL